MVMPIQQPDGSWESDSGEPLPVETKEAPSLTWGDVLTVGTFFDSYQYHVHLFAKYADREDLTPELREAVTFLYPSSKLAGEAGEVSEKLAKLVRDKGVYKWSQISPEDKAALVKELGDCLWYISEIATRMNVTLSEVAEENYKKLAGRVQRGTIHGSGDNR